MDKEVKGGDLVKFREKSGANGKPMSRLDLAKLLGYSGDSTIWRWENGTRPIPKVAQSAIRRLFQEKNFKF